MRKAATDRVIIKLKTTVKRQTVRQFVVQPLAAGETVSAAVARLSSREDVEYVSPDQYIMVQATVPNDPFYVSQYGPTHVGAETAWDFSTGGPAAGVPPGGTVTVCAVDSGVDAGHPDLQGNLHPAGGLNAYDASQLPTDTLGHGTHVAGIVAAVGNNGQGVAGINWSGVKVLPCKFIGPDGYGLTSDAITCLQYCAAQGAQIISASWTSGFTVNQPLQDALNAAGAAGMLVVVAAGNQGLSLDTTASFPASYSSSMPFLVAVGASDETDSWASFSNYGGAVTLSAPGVSILSTVPGGSYESWTGTSMATPFVSGAAALLLAAAGGRLSNLQLKSLLVNAAMYLPALAGRSTTGGLLRIDSAMQVLLNQPALRQVPQPQPTTNQPTLTPQPQPQPTTTQPSPRPASKPKCRDSTGCALRCGPVRDQRGRLVRRCAYVREVVKQRMVASTHLVRCRKGSRGCHQRCQEVRDRRTGKLVRRCSYMRSVTAQVPQTITRFVHCQKGSKGCRLKCQRVRDKKTNRFVRRCEYVRAQVKRVMVTSYQPCRPTKVPAACASVHNV